MFFNKEVSSKEYDTLCKRLSELDSRLVMLETHIKSQELENKLLRDKVLRKIQDGKDNPYSNQSQSLNSSFPKFGI
jgi:hypothetical protein